MTSKKKWLCSVDGCSFNDRACDRMAGVTTNPKEEVKFIKESETGAHYCDAYARWMTDAYLVLQSLETQAGSANMTTGDSLLTPAIIFELLKNRVVGQDKACRSFATAMHDNTILREIRSNPDCTSMIENNGLRVSDLKKSNILIIGPTGCGKTLLAEEIVKILNQPSFIYGATAGLTSAGYVGTDVEQIIIDYFVEVQRWMNSKTPGSGENPEDVAAWINQNGGTIFLDEVDKLRASSGGKDVNGRSVQERLLTLFQGEHVYVPTGREKGSPTVMIDTTNIQFVMMGVFEFAEQTPNSIGFGRETKTNTSTNAGANIATEGFISQFIGRIGFTINLRQLGKDDYLKILTSVDGNLVSVAEAKYQCAGMVQGTRPFSIVFADDALELIAEKGAELKTGARGLRKFLNTILEDIDFYYLDLEPELDEIYISRALVAAGGTVIEEGPDKTFRKSNKPRLEQVETKLPLLLTAPKGKDS